MVIPARQEQEQVELKPETTLTLKLEDQDTKNQATVQIQLFQREDQLKLVQEVVQASMTALIRMGMVDPQALELKTQIHTLIYRKRVVNESTIQEPHP